MGLIQILLICLMIMILCYLIQLLGFEKPITDQWTHAELNLPQGEQLRKEKIVGQSKDTNDEIIGSYDPNPFLSTLKCHVEFLDGEIKECLANVIAENMRAQEDEDCNSIQILDSIVYYRKDRNVVDKADAHLHTNSREHNLLHTNYGWSLLTLLKNGDIFNGFYDGSSP